VRCPNREARVSFIDQRLKSTSSASVSAGGIALINAIGYTGGMVGPVAIGWAKDAYGSFEGGLYLLSLLSLIGVVLTLLVVRSNGSGNQERRPKKEALKVPTKNRIANA
jgi:ACS family tartrate transporter-like MFS transporter